MAKKKQVNQAARIAEAVDWIDAVLEDDACVAANVELKKGLNMAKAALMKHLLANARESGSSGAAKGRGGKKERYSAQEPAAGPGHVLNDTKTSF